MFKKTIPTLGSYACNTRVLLWLNPRSAQESIIIITSQMHKRQQSLSHYIRLESYMNRWPSIKQDQNHSNASDTSPHRIIMNTSSWTWEMWQTMQPLWCQPLGYRIAVCYNRTSAQLVGRKHSPKNSVNPTTLATLEFCIGKSWRKYQQTTIASRANPREVTTVKLHFSSTATHEAKGSSRTHSRSTRCKSIEDNAYNVYEDIGFDKKITRTCTTMCILNLRHPTWKKKEIEPVPFRI